MSLLQPESRLRKTKKSKHQKEFHKIPKTNVKYGLTIPQNKWNFFYPEKKNMIFPCSKHMEFPLHITKTEISWDVTKLGLRKRGKRDGLNSGEEKRNKKRISSSSRWEIEALCPRREEAVRDNAIDKVINPSSLKGSVKGTRLVTSKRKMQRISVSSTKKKRRRRVRGVGFTWGILGQKFCYL